MIRIWMLTWPVTPRDPKKKSIEKTPLVKADSVESYESVEVPVSDDRIHPISSGKRSEDQTSLLKPTGNSTHAPDTYKQNGYLVPNGRESTLPLRSSDSREDKIVPDTNSTLNANPPNKAGGDGFENEEDRQRYLHSSPDKGLEKSPGSDSRHDGLPPKKQTLFQMANNRRNSGQNDGTDDRLRTLPSSPDSKLGNHGNGYQDGDETSLLIGPGNSRTPGGKDDRGSNSGSDGPHRYGAIPGERNGNSHSDIESGDSSAAYPNSDSSLANGTEDRDRRMSPDGHTGDERETDGSWSGDTASLVLPPSGRKGSNAEKEGKKDLKGSERRDKELPSNQSRGRRLEASPGRTSKSRSPSLNSKRPNEKDKEIPLRKEKPPVPTVKKLGFGSTYKQPKPEAKDGSKDPKKRRGSGSKTPKNASEVIEPEMVRNTKTQKPVSAAPPGGKGRKPGGADNSKPGQDTSPGATEAVTPDDGDIDAEAPLTFVVPEGGSHRKASYPQDGYLVLYNDIEDSDDKEFVDEESSTDLHTLPRRPKPTSGDEGQGQVVAGEGWPRQTDGPEHLDLQFDAGEASDDPYDDHGSGPPGPRAGRARGPGGAGTERREIQGASTALHTLPGGGGRGYDNMDVDNPGQGLRRPAVDEASETANAGDAPHRKLRGVPRGTVTDADPPAINESTPVAVKMAAPRGAAGAASMDDPRARAPHGGKGGAPPGMDAARSQRELQGSEPATLMTAGGDADKMGLHDQDGQPLRRPVVDEDSVAGEGGKRTKGSPASLNVRRAPGDDDVIVPEDAHVSHAQLQARGVDTPGGRIGDAGLSNGKDGDPIGKDAARSQRELQGSGPETLPKAGGDADSMGLYDEHGQPLRRPVVDEDSVAGEGGRRTKGSPASLNVRRAAGDDDVIVPEDAHVSHAQLQAKGADTGGGRDNDGGMLNGKDGAPIGKDAARSQRELQGSGPETLPKAGGVADSMGLYDEHGQPLRRPVVDEDSVVGEGGRRTKGSPASLNVRRAVGDDDVIVPEDAHVSHAQLQAKGVDTGGGRDGDAGLRNGKDGAPPGMDAARSQRELQGSGPATFTTAGGDEDSMGLYDEHGQPLRRPVVDEDSMAGEGGRRTKGSPASLNVRRAPGDDDVIVPEDANVSHAQLQAKGVGGHDDDAGLRNGKDGAPPGKDAARSQRELQGSGPATFTTAGGNADSMGLYDEHGQPLRRPVVDEDSMAGEGGKRTKGSPASLNVRRAPGDDDVIVPEDANVSHAQLQAKGVGGHDDDTGLRNGKDGAPPGMDAARSQRELQGSGPTTLTTAGGDGDSMGLYDEHGQPLRRPVVDEDSMAGESGRRTKGSPASLNVRRAPGDDDMIVPEDANVSHAQLQAKGVGGHDDDAGLRNGKDGAPPGKDAARSQRELQGSGPATVTTAGGDADSMGLYDEHGQPLRRPVVDEDSVTGEGGRRTKGSPASLNVRRAAGDDDVIVPEDAHVSHAQLQAKGADTGDSPRSLDVRRAPGDEEVIVPEGASVSHTQFRPSGDTGDNGRGRNIAVLSRNGQLPDGQDTPSSKREMDDPGLSTNIKSTARPSDGDGMRGGQQGDALRRPGDGVSPANDADHAGRAPHGGVSGASPEKDAARSQRELQGSEPATLTTAGGDADSMGLYDQHGQPLRRPVVDEDSMAGEGGKRTKGSPASLNVRRAAGDDGVIVPEDANVSHAQLQARGADTGGRRDGHGDSPRSLDVRRAPGDEDVIVPEGASVSHSQFRPSGGTGDNGRGRNIAVLSGDGQLPDGQDAPSSQREMDDPGLSTHVMSTARPSDGDGMRGGQQGDALRRPGDGESPAYDTDHAGRGLRNGKDGDPPGMDAARSQRELQGSGPATLTKAGGVADSIGLYDEHGQPLRRPAVDEDSVTGEGGRRTKGSPASLNVRRAAGDNDVIVPEDAHISRAQLQARGADTSGGRDYDGGLRNGKDGAPPGVDAARSQRELQGSGPATLTKAGGVADSIGLYDEHGQPLRRPVVDEDSVAGEGGRRTKGSPASLNVRRAAGDDDVIVPEDAHVSHAQLQATGAGTREGLRGAPDRGDVTADQHQTLESQKPGINVVLIEKGNEQLPDGEDTPSSQREMDDPGLSTHIMSAARPSDGDGMAVGQQGDALRRPGDGESPAHDSDPRGGGLRDAPDRGDVTADQHQTLESQKPGINVVLIEKAPLTPGERRHAEALKMNAFIDRVHIELPPTKLRIVIFVRPGCWTLPYNETSGSGAPGQAPAHTQQKKQNVSFGDTPDRTMTHKSKSVDEGEVARKRKTFARVSRKGSRRLSRLRSFKRSSSLEDVENLEPVMPHLAPVEPADKRQTMMKKTRSLDALDDDQPIWFDRHKSIDLSHIEARREYTRELEIIQGDSVKQLVKGFEDYSRRVSRDWTATSFPL